MGPMLILVNGVPASGKTTLAQKWSEHHVAGLPLCIDIDWIRFMLGGWRDALQEAGFAARDIAIAGIEAHLRGGRDVVVPQYLRRHEFIDRLEATASAQDALFIETALIIDAATAEVRFHTRAELAAHMDTHGTLPATMTTVVSEFDVFLASRPRVIRLTSGDDALARLDAAITDSASDQITH